MKTLQPELNPEDKSLMEKLLSARHIQHKYAIRLQTIKLRDKGKGIDSLIQDKTRKPGKKPVSQKTKNEIYKLVCNEKPKGETHWSCRTLAKKTGIGKTAVNRILQEFNLQPHKVSKRNYSNDPKFEEKLNDVVGLYLNPPKNSIILCVDEKTQIQALERSQPILPVIRNVPERQSSDYFRHGTTTLFAALDYLNGNIIGECKERHTSEDYIDFLKKLDKECPKRKVLHIVTDNLSAHKTKAVYEYLDSKPKRFVLHFIPTHSSWLNLVERWFAEITNKRIRRGNFKSVNELKKAIKDYIKTWNNSGRSFIWTKSSNEIITKIKKATS